MFVYVADSEADIYELLVEARRDPREVEWIVRACQNRALDDTANHNARASWVVRRESPPPQPSSLSQMVRMVAQLGGYVNRKRDDEPGPQTVRLDLQRMHDIDLVGEPSTYPTFDAERVTGLSLAAFATDMGLNFGRFMTRPALIEFVFEGRIQQSHVRRSGC